MPSEKWLKLNHKEFFTPEEQYLHRKLETKNSSSIKDSRELSFCSPPARPLTEAGLVKKIELSVLQINVQKEEKVYTYYQNHLTKFKPKTEQTFCENPGS